MGGGLFVFAEMGPGAAVVSYVIATGLYNTDISEYIQVQPLMREVPWGSGPEIIPVKDSDTRINARPTTWIAGESFTVGFNVSTVDFAFCVLHLGLPVKLCCNFPLGM